MTVHLREADGSDDDLGSIVTIVNATCPDDPTSVDEIRWAAATYPGTTRFIAEVDGRPVGVGSVGRIYMHPPEFDALWATIAVLAHARRQGIGGALLTVVAERARAAGKGALHIPASEGQPEGIAFLRHRGFMEYERDKIVRLELAGKTPPAIDLPDGIELTTLAQRPDLVPAIHAVAVETFADIPGGEVPTAPGTLAEFRARDVDRPSIPPGAFVIALEPGTDRVVGYASLLLMPVTSRRMAWHAMTAVVRDWRGRGLARALKRATIGWAMADGLDALESGNDFDNAPMRAVNARLGYEPQPDHVILRGSLDDGMMAP